MIGERPTARTKLAVVKVRGGMKIEVVCLGEEPLGFFVHWLGTRSFLCPGQDCPACYAAIGARWNGMLPVRVVSSPGDYELTGVLELTSGAFDRLVGLLRMEGWKNVLGCRLEVSRQRDRSALRLEPIVGKKGAVSEVVAMPGSVLRDGLATLYGLPSCPDGMSAAEWEAVALPRAIQLLRVAVPRAVVAHPASR